MRLARAAWWPGIVVLVVVGAVACQPALHAVDDGVYGAFVPTAEHLTQQGAGEVPGGFAALSSDGVGRVSARIEGDTVTLTLDGTTAGTRTIVERRDIQDAEGSGPFKAQTEVLVLGDEPLVLASLSIPEPVIWYSGGHSATKVITIKPWDPAERGPIVQCAAADIECLELPLGGPLTGDPAGTYTNMNDPALTGNPVTGIRITAADVVYTLDTGTQVRVSRAGESMIAACALSRSTMWDVPAAVGVAFKDPVLVETACPLPYGQAPAVTIMERAAVPVLAPLAPEWGGQWCEPGPACLWFIDEEGGVG